MRPSPINRRKVALGVTAAVLGSVLALSGAGSVAVSARPALPTTMSTSAPVAIGCARRPAP